MKTHRAPTPPTTQAAPSTTLQALQATTPSQTTPATPASTETHFARPQQTQQDAHFARSAQQAPTTKISPLALQIQQGLGDSPIAQTTTPSPIAQTTGASAPTSIQPPPTQQSTQNAQATQAAAPISPQQRDLNTIQEFYQAMQARDLDKIMSLYHPDATFSDPAFPHLKGDKLRAMWKLITSNDVLKVSYRDVKAQPDGTIQGHWDADYSLIKGNPILNSIDSTFVFKDGKIIQHTDRFDFSKWADQAFPGILGKALGTRPGQWLMQKVILPFALR